MALIRFQDLTPADRGLVGGKAWGLAQMLQLNYNVPSGLILTKLPADENEWSEIFQWWKSIDSKPLAVRSSAAAEDSASHSFAGQNASYLNISDLKSLKTAIKDCFESIHLEASQAYRKFFKQPASRQAQMNVILQEMVFPKYSGVYFSYDPVHSENGWLIEFVDGFADRLVSGQVKPMKLSEFSNVSSDDLPSDFSVNDIQSVAATCKELAEKMGFAADIEWALDQNKKLQLVQIRPITTLTKTDSRKELVEKELERLRRDYPKGAVWDGQTFSEWTGFPSYFTFSLWKNAFSPYHAFGNALSQLGYLSFVNRTYSPKDSLLERVFGRAYVNLEKLTTLYYGPIPYTVVPKPRPHTKFNIKKLNLRTIMHMPFALKSMIWVSWNLSTKRKSWLERCSQELNQFKDKVSRPLSLTAYATLQPKDLLSALESESWKFAKNHLHWPLVLVVLTESTVQRLQHILVSILGEKEASLRLRLWMGKGLQTMGLEMQKNYQEALSNANLRAEFLARYGHRGPGELDLSNPRWLEMGDAAFYELSEHAPNNQAYASQFSVTEDIQNLKSFKREIVFRRMDLFKEDA